MQTVVARNVAIRAGKPHGSGSISRQELEDHSNCRGLVNGHRCNKPVDWSIFRPCGYCMECQPKYFGTNDVG